jgi:hypothetical protein
MSDCFERGVCFPSLGEEGWLVKEIGSTTEDSSTCFSSTFALALVEKSKRMEMTSISLLWPRAAGLVISGAADGGISGGLESEIT